MTDEDAVGVPADHDDEPAEEAAPEQVKRPVSDDERLDAIATTVIGPSVRAWESHSAIVKSLGVPFDTGISKLLTNQSWTSSVLGPQTSIGQWIAKSSAFDASRISGLGTVGDTLAASVAARSAMPKWITDPPTGRFLTASLPASQLLANLATVNDFNVGHQLMSAGVQRSIDSILASLPKITTPKPDWFSDLDFQSFIRALKRRQLPANWHDVDRDIDDEEESVKGIMNDGIPLAWVPNAHVIERLLAAQDIAERRRVIWDNHRGILTDCENQVASLAAHRALYFADMIRRSISAFRDGYHEPAQALATNVLDTVLREHTEAAVETTHSVLKNQSFRTNIQKMGWPIALALWPIASVMSGDHRLESARNAFRRNATAHGVARDQYTKVNATLAIMNATAVLACYVRDTDAFYDPE